MTKDTRLQLMTKNKKYIPKHCQVACDVLEDLKNALTTKGISPKDDTYWPFHILVSDSKVGNLISLSCNGFRRTIDVQRLRSDGLADTRYKKVSFSTPSGAANYVLRELSK